MSFEKMAGICHSANVKENEEQLKLQDILFEFKLYIPVTNISVMSGHFPVFLCNRWNQYKAKNKVAYSEGLLKDTTQCVL